MNRANTNYIVFKRANDEVNAWDVRRRGNGGFSEKKEIIPISEYYEQRRRKLIAEIVMSTDGDPIGDICVDRNTLRLKDYGTRRVGRPRNNWWNCGIKQYWEYLQQFHIMEIRGQQYDENNIRHVQHVKEAIVQGQGIPKAN